MDWNIKPSSQWDWDSLSVLDGKGSENPKHIMSQPVEWIVDNGSLYSSGGGGCSGSDLVNVCSSKSSISASTDTMPPGTRNSEIGFQPTKVSTNHFSNKKEISRAEDSAASSEAVPFTGSGEPPIGLKLGRRTYFEDISPGSDIKASYLPAMPARTTTTPKKSRVSHQITQIVCCQVEGCGIDLSSAKGYHRKHKVCESHSKCPKVIVAGRERRFCQQCSRFHDLSEFDQKKRSCRRRLSDHNARRRKPPPEMISFGSNRFSSSFYDDGHQINFLMNKTPFGYLRTDTSSMWGNSSEFRLPQSRESFISTTKEGGTGGQLRLPINEFSSSASTFRYDVGRLLPSKGTTVEILNQGLGASTTASNLDESPDIRRALSLLSNDTWGLANHEPSPSLNQIVHLNHTNNAGFCATHATHSSSDNWLAELPLGHESRELPCTFYNSAGQFQEIQLLKAPYGSGSFDSN